MWEVLFGHNDNRNGDHQCSMASGATAAAERCVMHQSWNWLRRLQRSDDLLTAPSKQKPPHRANCAANARRP
ncbi:uncharacterized protein Dsimw501_GD28646, isoform B [Drosophila simulans]|uniref:Uncharacterized protein, isoform B n=1 Tax=Drosophila simulans TaxID=7240 RepID=A0A0J9RYY6_DROSI|nr:uncharacterized protein Dsimw501_GD28646, isoform B [Drosophila simulans]